MIRRAVADEIPNGASDERCIRIAALQAAYGNNVDFIQYFTDENGSFLSVMDGVGVLYSELLTEEWYLFLLMNPDIRKLHCSGQVGEELLRLGGWQGEGGIVMRYSGDTAAPVAHVCTTPYLPKVYALLEKHFPSVSPFNYWYPDVSHRIRHQCSHIACIVQEDNVVSTAMTVAETGAEAIIGQVVTAPCARRRGFASKCIKSVISQCKGKSLYILPMNDGARLLYENLGFVPCGTWFELEKTL